MCVLVVALKLEVFVRGEKLPHSLHFNFHTFLCMLSRFVLLMQYLG